MSGIKPGEGRWGPLGTAGGSVARTATDLGFESNQSFENWKKDRDVYERETKGSLGIYEETVSPEGEIYDIESERSEDQADYDAAVRAFETAEGSRDIASGEFGDVTAETWEDIPEAERGSYYEEAGAELERDEMQRQTDISELESQRAGVLGKTLTAEERAEQARMSSGLEYSGTLERRIAQGKMGAEGALKGFERDETGVIGDWKTAVSDYEGELSDIQTEWTIAKKNWQDAYDVMHGGAGEKAQYEDAMVELDREGRKAIIDDLQMSGGLEDLKTRYVEHWTLGGSEGGGRAGGEAQWKTGNLDVGPGSGITGGHTSSSWGGSFKMTGARPEDFRLGAGYGGFGAQEQNIQDRYDLAKAFYGSDIPESEG